MSDETEPVTESPLLTPRPSSGGLDRPDVVLRKGRFTLLNGHLTPQQSMIEDLLFLDDALTAVGRKQLTIETGRWNRLVDSIARVMDPGPTPENA